MREERNGGPLGSWKSTGDRAPTMEWQEWHGKCRET